MCEEIESAARHLHGLGLAHNDITTFNIMIFNDGAWKLIDFDACQPLGEDLTIRGTSAWTEDGEIYNSAKKNDEIALWKLREWIQRPEIRRNGISRTIENL
ncbi:hypothetical protein CDD83_9302 [Cordyceps sp. RAO-2017]|nr:hypothetical protein CDD83_9302 [Cordyceps sp. RAO-2017]